jgi:hypothetical protein
VGHYCTPIHKRPSAAFQSLIGLVHFFVMLFIARQSSLKIASSLGKDPRVLVTFLRDMFSDSMVLNKQMESLLLDTNVLSELVVGQNDEAA